MAQNPFLSALPNPGLGLGLRNVHFNYILEHWPPVDWFEVISENFMDSGGRPRHVLNRIAERYPIVMHGVSMSIGSTDPLNFTYLHKLKALAAEVKPAWISDHLCWTGVLGHNTHDLLPVPLNEETLRHISKRVIQVQDFLERPLILENPSTYLSFKNSDIPEWEFLRLLTEETGCGLLVDVNNIYVTCFNNDIDPMAYMAGLPYESIVQMHIAGHQHCGTHIVDTHDSKVIPSVWELFRMVWQKTGGVATLLEWDNHIPSFDEYHAELLKARSFMGTEVVPQDAEESRRNGQHELSNPINFLMSDVSADVHA
jgi:uncharacterized protein (UPF0276 family)